jgi:hypothetical protein
MRVGLLLIAIPLLCSSLRVRSYAQSVIPPETVELWSAIIGDWKIEGTVSATAITGLATFEWVADKHCYVGREVWHVGNNGRDIQLALIGGWEAATNETVEQGFSSAGSSATVHFSLDNSSELPGRVTGKIEGTSGPNRQWCGTVERVQRNANEFTLSTTIDGEVVHSLTYTRVARGARPDSESAGRPEK